MDGSHNVTVYANDTAGNLNSTIHSFTVDTTQPNVSLESPVDYFNTSATAINYTFNVTDNIASTLNCSLYINGSYIQSNSSTANGTSTTFLNVAVGEGNDQNWTVNCSDSANNSHQPSARVFNVDWTKPTITFINPSDNDSVYVSRNWTYVNVTVTDSALNIESCLLEWNGSNESMIKAGSGNSVSCSLNKSDGDGNYSYKVYANDSAGNFNVSESRMITFDTTKPTEPTPLSPGNNTVSIDLSPELNWSTVTEINFRNYTVEVSDDSGFGYVNYTYNTTERTDSNYSVTENWSANKDWYWRVTAYDKASNYNTSGVFKYTTDIISSIITFVDPSDVDHANVSRNHSFVNVSVVDATSAISSCLLEWDGVNESMTKAGSGNSVVCYINKSYAEGSYIYKVWANDSAGNWNHSETRSITFDVTEPTIRNISLNPSVILGNASIQITVNVSDNVNVSVVWASITKPDGVENVTLNYSGQLYNATFTNTTHPGVYNVTVYVNDSAGNINSSNVSFTVAPYINNSDCGADSYVGGTYCHSHDVYRLYRTYTCSDAGTASSSCSHSDADSLITDCGENYIVYSSNYCSGNNVVRDATLIIRDCDSSTVSCYSEIGGVNTEVVEECGVNYTCINGSCVGGGATTTTTTSTTTTVSVTTTTSSTTTTVTWPCELQGDYPPCAEVILAEVMDYILLWSNGEASLSDVVALINAWAEGYSSTTTTTTTSTTTVTVYSTSTVTSTSSSTVTITTTTMLPETTTISTVRQ